MTTDFWSNGMSLTVSPLVADISYISATNGEMECLSSVGNVLTFEEIQEQKNSIVFLKHTKIFWHEILSIQRKEREKFVNYIFFQIFALQIITLKQLLHSLPNNYATKTGSFPIDNLWHTFHKSGFATVWNFNYMVYGGEF